MLLHSNLLCSAPALAADPLSTDTEIIRGFNKTIFESEYGGGQSPSQVYVRKFSKTVRFYLRIKTNKPVQSQLQQFILSLPSLISGLDVQLVNHPARANFVVHVVPRSAYVTTVRNAVYKDKNKTPQGRCMVRSIYSRSGIKRSDAVIVADQGDSQFKRCMIEEILQGLGPLNDDPALTKSMFNDQTRFTTLQRFDRMIVSLLYDPAIKAGASRQAIEAVLPTILRRVRRHIDQQK